MPDQTKSPNPNYEPQLFEKELHESIKSKPHKRKHKPSNENIRYPKQMEAHLNEVHNQPRQEKQKAEGHHNQRRSHCHGRDPAEEQQSFPLLSGINRTNKNGIKPGIILGFLRYLRWEFSPPTAGSDAAIARRDRAGVGDLRDTEYRKRRGETPCLSRKIQHESLGFLLVGIAGPWGVDQ